MASSCIPSSKVNNRGGRQRDTSHALREEAQVEKDNTSAPFVRIMVTTSITAKMVIQQILQLCLQRGTNDILLIMFFVLMLHLCNLMLLQRPTQEEKEK
jgi:hypothetical protein